MFCMTHANFEAHSITARAQLFLHMGVSRVSSGISQRLKKTSTHVAVEDMTYEEATYAAFPYMKPSCQHPQLPVLHQPFNKKPAANGSGRDVCAIPISSHENPHETRD
jgi:hypothetical protein